jgi:hypothetical protein
VYFKCPIKGCEQMFLTLKDLDNHSTDKHCEECGASEGTNINPIDRADCIACDGENNDQGERRTEVV